jgi:hypothetical protein
MTRDRKPEGNPANRRIDRPQDARQERHESEADAASRLDVPPVRLGAELSSDPRPGDETETADALKRAAADERRT